MFKARIYSDTWGDRKTASDMVQTPLDILEHILRLQNKGTEYDPSITVKLTGQGGIDEIQPSGITDKTGYTEGLWTPADLRPARQLFEENQCWTDALITDLCRTFFLLNYQDQGGAECVSYLFGSGEAEETVTFGDIVGNVGSMVEPAAADIFCEPYINYAYDYATGEYTKQLRISGVKNSEWSPEHTAGYDSDDGQATWELCRGLYNRVKQINPMPESMANQPWIVRYEDAVWYLRKLTEWMGKKRVDFTVSYEKAREWVVGQKIKLNLPYHTDELDTDCIIEDIRKNKQRGTVRVRVVLLPDLRFKWIMLNLNTGQSITTYGKNVTFSSLASGNWLLTLIVTDGSDTSERTALVYINDKIEIVSWEWLTDGATYQSPTMEHEYAEEGGYSLKLTVTDSAGGVDEEEKLIITDGAVVDADGNVYSTITIGNQEWTVENWRSTKYADGVDISGPSFTNAAWAGLTTPAYCWYDNTEDEEFREKYGALYNWFVVDPENPHNIAPDGWRVPTLADFDQLRDYLIDNGFNWDESTTGNKIGKSMASSGGEWAASVTEGRVGNDQASNNSSGWNGLPGGRRAANGFFYAQSTHGQWWASTTPLAYARSIRHAWEDFADVSTVPSEGKSIRLVRDIT